MTTTLNTIKHNIYLYKNQYSEKGTFQSFVSNQSVKSSVELFHRQSRTIVKTSESSLTTVAAFDDQFQTDRQQSYSLAACPAAP